MTKRSGCKPGDRTGCKPGDIGQTELVVNEERHRTNRTGCKQGDIGQTQLVVKKGDIC